MRRNLPCVINKLSQLHHYEPPKWASSSTLTIFPILFTKITLIADISSMQDACHIWTSLQTLLTVKSIWLNGRASEKGIRSSEVRFLMRSKNIFFVPQSTKNILFHFFTELKIDHLILCTKHRICLLRISSSCYIKQ